MTLRALRGFASRTGRGAILLGMLGIIAGVCFSSPSIISAGCVAVFGGAYVWLYGEHGGF